MKIVILSAASAVHTVRWVNGLASLGHEIVLVSSHKLKEPLDNSVRFILLPFSAPWGYYANTFALRSILKDINPDILNAHFASGYGTLARLCRFSPMILSVWGSDVYDFPKKSRIHRKIVMKNIMAADSIASTSHCMLRTTKELYPHHLTFVTPFGVDVDKFIPGKKQKKPEIVFGTVKTLSFKYGIDTLLEAFKIFLDRSGGGDYSLEITGDGPDRNGLEQYALDLGIGDLVTFFGNKPHDQVVSQLQRLDVYMALSRLDSESFGVAILEASACCLPVIVSDVDGLKEVTIDGETGIIVPKESPEHAAEAMMRLARDSNVRSQMGDFGRRHVEKNYSWQSSLEKMVEAYEMTLS